MTKSKSDELDDTMRVLTSGTCDTLTDTSRLTYDIGTTPEGGIYLRVPSNTGGGFFNDEWIAFEDILQRADALWGQCPCERGDALQIMHCHALHLSSSTPKGNHDE